MIFPVSMRVPEDVLIVSSLCVAVLGAELGRRVFRHKTVDEKVKAKY